MAFSGLKFNLREWFEGQTFTDLFQLITRMSMYEHLLKEEDKKPYADYNHKVALVNDYGSEDEYDHDETAQKVVAKMILDKPYVGAQTFEINSRFEFPTSLEFKHELDR